MRTLLTLALVAIFLPACTADSDNGAEQAATSKPSPTPMQQPAATTQLPDNPMRGLPTVPIPADNPRTPAKIALGQQLFEDRRFSANGEISCSHCHVPANAFVDSIPQAAGINDQIGTRNTPTVINAAYYTRQFWDGRRSSLEEQAKDPFVNPIEHGLKDHQKIVDIVRTDENYQQQFTQVFNIDPDTTTIEHVVKAIASFERSIIGGDSPFDRYQYGGDKNALSEPARRGLELYRGKARCVGCHTIEETTALFTDNDFHNLGVGFKKIEHNLAEILQRFGAGATDTDKAVLTQAQTSELGRYAVTRDISDLGRFKTSSLRNIALTAPYMHDGSLATLAEVIDFYDRGGEYTPALDGGMRPLGLTQMEKTDLLAFLESLTSSRFAKPTSP